MVEVERFFCFPLKLIISVQAKTLCYSQSVDGNRNEKLDGQVADGNEYDDYNIVLNGQSA